MTRSRGGMPAPVVSVPFMQRQANGPHAPLGHSVLVTHAAPALGPPTQTFGAPQLPGHAESSVPSHSSFVRSTALSPQTFGVAYSKSITSENVISAVSISR